MPDLMQGFPPAPNAQVTLANWRNPPYSRWGFQHVREIVPSADIANDPDNVWALPTQSRDFSTLRIEDGKGHGYGLEAYLEHSATDSLVVLYKGRIVLERYRNGMTADTPHILMSVSKSMLGLLAGILAAKGILDPERLVSDLVPEVKETAYAGATVRHLLDMRTGVDFDENYLATSGPIVAYRTSTGWNPREPGDPASDLRSFYTTLSKRIRPHGQDFHYVSPNTDLLGWVIERAAGQRYADLMSALLWRPLGAARSAYITVDRLGAPRCAGGMCATVRDLARVGQLLVQGGERDGASIIPATWIADIAANGDPQAWNAGPFTAYFSGAMHYRAKSYVLRGPKPVVFGFGIHGQYLYVDLKNEVVIAKVSSEGPPIDAEAIELAMRAFADIGNFLTKA